MYNLEKELKVKGMYAQEGLWYGVPYAPVEKLSQPITPKENLKRYYKGENYKWIPDPARDQIDITPDCNLDVLASGYEGGYDAFKVKWIPIEDNKELPAFVEPGFKLLEDIADWKTLEWPQPDNWDWAECSKKYNEIYKDDDRMRRGIILSGYFERLISIMTFEEAAVALASDIESVNEFFDKITILNINIMDHYIDDFKCEAIMLHDDWSAQRSPFFSPKVAMEVFAPQLKKLVEHAHSKGVIFTLHSCGNGVSLVPAMIEAGVDGWQAQSTAIDIQKAIEACDGKLVLETYPDLKAGIHGKELEDEIKRVLEKYCVNKRCLIELYDFEEERLFETRKAVYKVSRMLAEKE